VNASPTYTAFILAAGAMALVTILILLQPWWRPWLRRKTPGGVKTADDASVRALNAAIYRDQLADLERDRATGQLAEADYAQASDELNRRLLEDAGGAAVVVTPAGKSKPTAWLAIMLLVPLAATSLYLQLGTPTAVLDSRAQAHAAAANMEDAIGKLQKKLEANPDNPEGWAMLARSYGALGRWDDAAQAFTRVGAVLETNAGLLAGLAEIEFRRAGDRFNDAARSRIKQALALEANNPHALMLAASDAMNEQNWAEAAKLWRLLLEQVEPGSDDANEISQVLAQAEQQAGIKPLPAAKSSAKTEAKVGADESTKQQGGRAKDARLAVANDSTAGLLSGRVELAAELRKQVQPDDTVFIFARAVAKGDVPAPRMPLAAKKIRAAELPYDFKLDDSMAMSPAMKISSFEQVRVEARVSRSGGVTPESGDLLGQSEPLKGGTRGIKVRIDKLMP
jgi:cytochrome c-type biogenesis protein CcmH